MTLTTSFRRRCAAAAMGGVVVYVLVDVCLQLLPPHYSAIHEAESNLAVGTFGWVMNLNFLGRAATTLCMVAAIGRTDRPSSLRRIGMMLFTIAAACSATLAFFATDVATGIGSRGPTASGLVHLWVAGLGFLAALSAVIVLTVWLRSSPGLTGAVPAAMVFAGMAAAGLLWLGLDGGLGLGTRRAALPRGDSRMGVCGLLGHTAPWVT
ncbi:DUF998 domain-containing protein [Arthrobacter cavernae]|uniref:DUF998 domain-containing protein n=1 Tax=Arthrobacter cavernae TaxID=2817681 RepID=A0A939HIK9_9MICC|nr:DUF998 domain-containing protein [Arthrobacter cavernae]MBO1268687.1 DUF998 domain-containing protein [Arthrobacter cavernae]